MLVIKISDFLNSNNWFCFWQNGMSLMLEVQGLSLVTAEVHYLLKFIFSKKATKIDEIFTVDLTFTK